MKQMTFLEFEGVRDDAMRVIDVRELEEYQAVHVKGAELFELSRIRRGERPELDDRQLVLICRSGARSAMAAQIFESEGASEIINVADGTLGAIKAGEQYLDFSS